MMVGPVAVVLLDSYCQRHHHYYYYHYYCYIFSVIDALITIIKPAFSAELVLLHNVHKFQTQFEIQTTAHFSTCCQSLRD